MIGRRPDSPWGRFDTQDTSQRRLDLAQGRGRDDPQSLHETTTRHRPNPPADCDAVDVGPFGWDHDWPQWGGRARTRHRDNDNQFIVKPDQQLVGGDDDCGPVLAWLAGARSTESN